MVFSTPIFLYLFLPLFALFYSFFNNKNIVLLVFSLVFYAWGEPLFVFLMVFVAWLNYIFAKIIGREQKSRYNILFVAVAMNVLVLVLFKYLDFIIANINHLIVFSGLTPINQPNMPLPMGISFFIFQAITYIVDVYRKECEAQNRFGNVLLYMTLFPPLVAGPIVRYKEISDQIRVRASSYSRVVSGAELFLIGLTKKVIIADSLAVPVDKIFSMPANEIGLGLAWLGLACYALQIFFDFSGYSDMAIGIGRAIGFDFPENFNQPYRARSIQDFWRRWHMTLSRWFRDYVYIPLGGNRLGLSRTYINLLAIFVLTGFWHGASWNFLIWGLIHGLFLVIERVGFNRVLLRLWAPLQHLYVLSVVLLAWVFFRAEDLGSALSFIKAMSGFNAIPFHEGILDLFNPFGIAIFLIGLTWSVWKERVPWCEEEYSSNQAIKYLVLISLLLISLAFISSYSQKSFIYFRF